MRAFRAEAVLALLASVVVASTGCWPSTSEQPPSPASSSPPPAAAARRVDLARLGSIADAFPPGHPANPLFGPGKVDEPTGSTVGDLVSYGKALTVDPDSCRALLKPVEAKAGADSASITSATGPQDPFIAVSADDPVSVPAAIPTSGCDRFAFAVQSAVPDGTVERLPAPSFDDAVTYALRVDFTVTNPNSTQTPLVEYFYNAILDGRTYVTLWARVPPDFAAEPVLPDLLSKAVYAIRGD